VKLPQTTARLFGRDADIEWLENCWAERVHVATLVAWGGVGKSALVNAWLARLRDAGWGGAERVYGWSFYNQGTDWQTTSDNAFIRAALTWFGDADPAQGTPWDKGERLASLVRKHRALLVLDGVEPLQWARGPELGRIKDPALMVLVRELGAHNEGLCVMTSQIEVADLKNQAGKKVQSRSLDRLSAEAGAELLRAQGAKGPEEELRAAAEEYGGHALALTLLGSYLRKAHKGDLRARGEIPPLGDAHAQRMMATYERWFDGKPELAILRMLGFFDRSATTVEIAALLAEPVIVGLTDTLKGVDTIAWNEAVTTLRDVGLLAGGAEGAAAEKLDAHPLVREYLGEQVRLGQAEAWSEGHRRLYEHFKQMVKERPETPADMAPLYEAVVHGCLAGRGHEALDEVWWKHFKPEGERGTQKLGAFGSEVAVFSAFFDPPWERLSPGLTKGLTDRAQGLLLNETGFALRALGRLPEAARLLQMAVARLEANGDWMSATNSNMNRSELLMACGELLVAFEASGQSVTFADRSGDEFTLHLAIATQATLLHARGLLEDASALFEKAVWMKGEEPPTYPQLLLARGFRYHDLLLDRGREAEVLTGAERALLLHERQNHRFGVALDHVSLGHAHLLAAQRRTGDDLARAARHLEQAVNDLRRTERQDHLPFGLLARAALHTHNGAFPEARRDLDETLTLSTRCGFRLHETDAHLGYARLRLAEGNPAAACPHLDKARVLIDATGYHRRDGELARLDAAAGNGEKVSP
jgi:tetratricopeptide (TPR) repeat protein